MLPLLYLLPLIILIEGFTSIAIEILTIRQLIPVAGNSVIVTSLIIGVFLLFLALGYQKGGTQQKNLQKILQFNFSFAAIWLGIGLSFDFISTFFNSIQAVAGSAIVYPLIAYLLLILAPLVYVLGQTIPITMNMIKTHHWIGYVGGNVLGLSTLGSFLGASLTSLFLMSYLGVAWTVFINFILLSGLAILLISENFERIFKSLFFLVAALVMYKMNVSIEQTFFFKTNSYANYQIARNQQAIFFAINNSASSQLDHNLHGFPYIEKIKHILFQELKLKDKNILVLGAGGFTLSAEGEKGNHFTYVDIDKAIKKIAIPAFQPVLHGTFIADDARNYVRNSKQTYDVIISDVYSNAKSIPAQLLTREYFSEIKRAIVPGGFALFNIIANPFLNDPYSKRVDNTLRSVFHHCMVIPLDYAQKPTNLLYVCAISNQLNDTKVYSDNLNTITTDFFAW